jgi:hypothetical protein
MVEGNVGTLPFSEISNIIDLASVHETNPFFSRKREKNPRTLY